MSETLVQISQADIVNDGNLVLSNVSFEMAKGEFVYLLGKVGSGKSSIIKTLIAELPLKKGNGSIAGFDLCKIKKRNIPYLRRKLGVVFQDFQLLMDRSVEDNLLFVLEATGWKRRKDGSRIIYHRERHESCYVEDFHEEASMAQEEDFIISGDGKKVAYRKTTREWIKRDNGDTKASGPYHETLKGKKAVDEVTEGLRNAILRNR